ncbi:MAG: VOC family protein [Gammaproteobacteria bacterium]
MSGKVNPIPVGYHSVTPYLVVKGAAAALDFYKQAFGAVEVLRMQEGGRVGHAEITIGDSRVMLADEHPEMKIFGPQSGAAPGVSIMLYVKDVDAVVKRAITAGAKLDRPVADQFYGDRMGSIIDPFGHRWHVGTHVEEVSPEELQKRMKETGK